MTAGLRCPTSSARLAIVGAVALWLVITLLNEVAAALVYVIAAVLALFLL